MSQFEQAVAVVLKHEGGWVDDPSDLGGETNFGISSLIIKREKISAEFLGLDPSTVGKPGWLKPMSSVAATKVYRQLFWDRYTYDNINDQTAATKVFDCAVNCGPSRAHAMAQRAAAACGHPCDDDGIIGPLTFAAINKCDAREFVRAMRDQMEKYYLGIIASRPANAKFKSNWLRRASWGVS